MAKRKESESTQERLGFEREYTPLPPRLRPKYETAKDMRLLKRAFCHDWVSGIPDERVEELVGDVHEFTERAETEREALTAAKTVAAANDYNLRQRAQEYEYQAYLMEASIVRQLRGLRECGER